MKPLTQVLVVDDDAPIRDFVKATLEGEGYQVVTAENGWVALQLLTSRTPLQPNIILLDMRMPIVDGWQFAQAYRELPGPKVPIIVLTAATDPARFAAQIKADNYLPKPFELTDLLDMVAQFTLKPLC
jgi:two-component system, chemotaxis family, chemotaxis protein CheY